jgi:N-alpha-acetyl-L-2,4-diaminobutyrate deacetylase
VNIEGVRIGRRGIDNIMKHMGLIEGTPQTDQRDGAPGTRHMMVRHSSAYVFAPRSGLFEPTHYVGETVEEGEVAADRIHCPMGNRKMGIKGPRLAGW